MAGGTLSGDTSIVKNIPEFRLEVTDNSMTRIFKNANKSADYGTKIVDNHADGSSVSLNLNAENDLFTFTNKSGISNILYGGHNKDSAPFLPKIGTMLGQASNGSEVQSNPWFKVGWSSLSGTNWDTYAILLVNKTWGSIDCGILAVKLRSGSSSSTNNVICKWLVRSSGITTANFGVAYNSDIENAKIELWYKNTESWCGYNFTVLAQGSRTDRYQCPWTFTSEGLTVGGATAVTSGYTYVESTDF